MTKMDGFEFGASLHGNWTVNKMTQDDQEIVGIDPEVDAKYLHIEWDGTTFTGTEDGGNGKVEGTVSEDGLTLVSLTISTSTVDEQGQALVMQFTLSSIPLDWPVGKDSSNPDALTSSFSGGGRTVIFLMWQVTRTSIGTARKWPRFLMITRIGRVT